MQWEHQPTLMPEHDYWEKRSTFPHLSSGPLNLKCESQSPLCISDEALLQPQIPRPLGWSEPPGFLNTLACWSSSVGPSPGCTLQPLGRFEQIPVPRLHSRPIKSESSGETQTVIVVESCQVILTCSQGGESLSQVMARWSSHGKIPAVFRVLQSLPHLTSRSSF